MDENAHVRLINFAKLLEHLGQVIEVFGRFLGQIDQDPSPQIIINGVYQIDESLRRAIEHARVLSEVTASQRSPASGYSKEDTDLMAIVSRHLRLFGDITDRIGRFSFTDSPTLKAKVWTEISHLMMETSLANQNILLLLSLHENEPPERKPLAKVYPFRSKT